MDTIVSLKKTSIHTTMLHVLGIQIQIYNIWETILQVDYVHLEKYSYNYKQSYIYVHITDLGLSCV